MLEWYRSFEAALSTWDRTAISDELAQAEQERAQILDAFPLTSWPDLAMERYALGTDIGEPSFCAWLEHNSPNLGHLPARHAGIHLIFKERGAGWRVPKGYTNERDAWPPIRAGFVTAFEHAARGEYRAIDALEVFRPGRLGLNKALHVYFPDRFLPISATTHLQHLAQRVLRERWSAEMHGKMGHAALNAAVLEALRSTPELGDRSTVEMMRFLYAWADPRAAKPVYKIAPGEQADLWPDCQRAEAMLIGWDEVGDLGRFGDEASFRTAFEKQYWNTYEGNRSLISRKAGEVWTYQSLKPGTVVVANRGISAVVGVGEVQEPGYQWLADRSHHRQGLKMRWDPLIAGTVPEQGAWPFCTVAEIPVWQQDSILGCLVRPSTAAAPSFDGLLQELHRARLSFAPETVADFLLALQVRRFVILTGISGTGKTQLALALARRFQGSGVPRHAVVAVRPDWTDNRGLLGYHNPLTGRYQITPFLRLLLNARAEADAAKTAGRSASPYFVVLDEMNLARVEHYFSDFLSALESGEPLELHGVSQTDPGLEQVPQRLSIPANLYFIGTVNVDETTYMFSPKVLDRAFCIELNDVDLSALGGTAFPDATLRLDRWSGALEGARRPSRDDWEALGLEEPALRAQIVTLAQLMDECGRPFGYRVATEIARYVCLAREQCSHEDAARTALDLALLHKVLPKLHGTAAELTELLDAFQGFALGVTGGHDRWKLAQRSWSFGDQPATPPLPRTAARLWRMRRRLAVQGFTSFIE